MNDTIDVITAQKSDTIEALTGTTKSKSSSLEDFQGTSLTCPGPFEDLFLLCRNLTNMISKNMPIPNTTISLNNTKTDGSPFSEV